MSAVIRPRRDNSAPSAPRRKTAQLSPELAEVLRMLEALEEQPDGEAVGPGGAR